MSVRDSFGIIFIISILTFGIFKLYPEILSSLGVIEETNITAQKSKKESIVYEKRYSPSISLETSINSNSDFIVLTSLISSILSFIGFVISSIFTIKRGKREEELYNLRKERERLELEKIQEELRALRGEA